MNAIISIFLGAIITIVALIYLRREVKKIVLEKNSIVKTVEGGNKNEIVNYIAEVEKNINQVNESFYEIASDLEGKYSVHEKKIELLEEEIQGLKVKLKTIHNENKSYSITNNKNLNVINQKLKIDDKKNSFKSESIETHKSLHENNAKTTGTVENTVSFDGLTVREKIIYLRSDGLEIQQIARKLNLGIGEIKLILNIRD